MINAQQARTSSLENKDSDLNKSLVEIEEQIVSNIEKGYFGCFVVMEIDKRDIPIKIAKKLRELGYIIEYKVDEEYDSASINIKW